MGYLGSTPATVPESTHQVLDNIVFDGFTSTYSLYVSGGLVIPGTPANLELSIGGVIQAPDTAYTVSGSTVTFTSVPAAAAPFFGKILGRTYDVGSVADLTITGPKLAVTAISDRLGYAPATPASVSAKQDALVSGTNIKTVGGTSLLGSGNVSLDDIPNIVRIIRTANTQIIKTNAHNLIDITSGTFNQTFAAAATLGSGWFVYIRNSGTGDITLDPNASETIDGLTSFVMYPGEVRLVQCDGAALRSVVLNTFYKTFTSSGTFTKPPGYPLFGVDVIGAGAGGGRSTVGGVGKSGGGGGGRFIAEVNSVAFGATETVTVGSGGLGATTNGLGGDGGASSIGAVALASGGLGSGGGGGGMAAHTSASSHGYGFAGANLSSFAEFGGGGGGNGGNNANGQPGGSSLRGGGGGGGGAGDYALDNRSGGAGGLAGAWMQGGGGTAGSVQAGGNGSDGNSFICGSGGGGGGTSAAGDGFIGGNGGTPGGGGGAGGGGGYGQASGGNGARGELRIWGII